jgi:uncharacterized protein YcnI
VRKHIISRVAVSAVTALVLVVASPGLAFAHVVISPNKALTGAYETFTTSVPNEKDIPVTGIRLVIPDSIESVTPTVKPGWEIHTKKSGDRVSEIIWTGGTIPAELRDTFTFSAHLPSKTGDIDWKAYQTYQDGSVVSWDQKPTDDHGHESEDESKGPYSTTTVTDTTDNESQAKNDSSNTVPYVISAISVIISAYALMRTNKK